MITTSLKPSEVDLLVKREIESGYDLYQPVSPQIFNKETPDRLNEKISVMGGDANIDVVAEGAAYPLKTFREIGTQTYTSVEYKEAYPVTELMQDFGNYGTVLKELKKTGYYARWKQDDLNRAVLSGGFDTTTTWDGEFLYSNSHEIKDTGETQDNLASGTLGEDNLFTAWAQLKLLADHRGRLQPITSAYLVVPTTLSKKAWELVQSSDGPETAERKKNFFFNALTVVEWPLLDAASTTAWFLLSEKMFHELCYFVKSEPKLKAYIDEETGNLVEKIRFVQVQGATDYTGTVASPGA